MYYEDLTPYEYGRNWPDFDPNLCALNVGWLDQDHEFPKRATEAATLSCLLNQCLTKKRHTTRGFHHCPFCPTNKLPIFVAIDDRRVMLGSAEVWIEKGDGGFYASPNLIYHYMASHQYRPPEEFLAAVLRNCSRC